MFYLIFETILGWENALSNLSKFHSDSKGSTDGRGVIYLRLNLSQNAIGDSECHQVTR